MRRRPGVAGLKRNRRAKQQFKAKAKHLGDAKLDSMRKQVSLFKEQLQAFAEKHKKQINKDPVFRHKFQTMCMKIGVNPLASRKGFWSQILGVGDFYYELAVQVIEVCLQTRAQNGGLISVRQLHALLLDARKGHKQKVSADDVCTAVKSMSALGNGFQLLTVGAQQMILSVPMEMSTDHSVVLEHAQARGYVTAAEFHALGWSKERVGAVLDLMVQEGMVWLDEQAPEVEYWFPSLFLMKFSS